MRRTAAGLAEAQSFDRVAVDLDQLSELNRGRDDLITTWLVGVLPRLARHAIDLGCGLGRHAVLLAGKAFAMNLVRRGPRTGWQIYRLSIRRAWLDHRVSDRFFSREELIRCCDALFPGYRLDILGGPRGIGLVWDVAAPPMPHP